MTNEKDLLLDLDCEEKTIRYLGDGVYAGFPGEHQVVLDAIKEC